jgi:hypothetical protein
VPGEDDSRSAGSRVEIRAGGHEVVVDAAVDLQTAVVAARELWHGTDNPNVVRRYSATGFALDTPEQALPAVREAANLPGVTEWPDEDRRPARPVRNGGVR